MKVVYTLDIDALSGTAEESLEIDGQELSKRWNMIGSYAETEDADYTDLVEGYATEGIMAVCDFFDNSDLVHDLLPIEYNNWE